MLLTSDTISERDKRNEMNKANVRWLILFLAASYLYVSYFFFAAESPLIVKNIVNISILAMLCILSNLPYHLFLMRKQKMDITLHPAWKYVSMFFDLGLVTLLLVPTGGSESMFFLLYVVVLLSNGMRYGMRPALAGALIFNLLYLVMLYVQYYPETHIPNFHREFLKVSGIWATGLYVGYLARRFQLLQSEVEKYKMLLRREISDG